MSDDLDQLGQRLQELYRPVRRTPQLDLSGPLGDDPLMPRGSVQASGETAKSEQQHVEKKAAYAAAIELQKRQKFVVSQDALRRNAAAADIGDPLKPVTEPADLNNVRKYDDLSQYAAEAFSLYRLMQSDAFYSAGKRAVKRLAENVLGSVKKPLENVPSHLVTGFRDVFAALSSYSALLPHSAKPDPFSTDKNVLAQYIESRVVKAVAPVGKTGGEVGRDKVKGTVADTLTDPDTGYQQFLVEFKTLAKDSGGKPPADKVLLLAKRFKFIGTTAEDEEVAPELPVAPAVEGATLPVNFLGEVKRRQRTPAMDLRGPLNDDPLATRGELDDFDTGLPDELEQIRREMEQVQGVKHVPAATTIPSADPNLSTPEDVERVAPVQGVEHAPPTEQQWDNVVYLTVASFNTLYSGLSDVIEDSSEYPDLFNAYFESGGFLAESHRKLRGVRLVEQDPVVPDDDEDEGSQESGLLKNVPELRYGAETESPDERPNDKTARELVNAASEPLAERATDKLDLLVRNHGVDAFTRSALEGIIVDAIETELPEVTARLDSQSRPEYNNPMVIPEVKPATPLSGASRFVANIRPMQATREFAPAELSVVDPHPYRSKPYGESLQRLRVIGEAFLQDAKVLERGGDLLFEAAMPVVPVRAFGGGLIDPTIAQEVDDPDLAHQLTKWHQLVQAKTALEQQLTKLMVDLKTGEIFDPSKPSPAMMAAPPAGGMANALAARKGRGVVASEITNAIGQLYSQMEPALKQMGDTQLRVDNVLFRLKQRERRTAAWRSVTKAMSKEVQDLAAQAVEDIPAKFQARRDAVKVAMDKLLGGMEKFLEPVAEMLEKAYMLAAEERVVTRQYTDIDPEVLLPQTESLLQEVFGAVGRLVGQIFTGVAGLFRRMWQGKKEVDDAVTVMEWIILESDDGGQIVIGPNGTPVVTRLPPENMSNG